MPEAPTVGGLLREALARMPRDRHLDVEWLLAHVLGLDRAGLRRERESDVAAPQLQRWTDAFDDLLAGTPVAQLLGCWEFWSLEFEIDRHVLIPRADTECLVEVACELATNAPAGPLVDLGTGSGAVAVCLARELPGRQVVAVERSTAALVVAARNVARLAPGRVLPVQGSWLASLGADSCALIVGNPPYVADDDPGLAADGPLRFEPRGALAAGPDGLDDLRIIAAQAPRRLLPGGWLALEHGADQGAAVRDLLAQQGLSNIETRRDLAGHDRVTLGQRPG